MANADATVDRTLLQCTVVGILVAVGPGDPKPIVLPTPATDTRISLRNHPICEQVRPPEAEF
jgi:hypothetical protein